MKLKNLVSLFLATALTLLIPYAAAEENAAAGGNNKVAGTGPNPYSDCGIGAAIFQETAWAAATSNVIWDLGTTALISATASPDTCSGKNVKAAQFIIDTYDNLVEESSQGKGEHLTTVMNIMECDSATHAIVANDIRKGAASVVNSANYDKESRIEKATRMFSVVFSATQGCSV